MTNNELISLINESLQKIPNSMVSTDFANGSGFVQQDIELVENLKQMMLQHCGYDCTFHWLGRYLDDGGSPLYSIWGRLINVDKLGREWGQMYYSLHPEDAKQLCLNPDFIIKLTRKNKLNEIEHNINGNLHI